MSLSQTWAVARKDSETKFGQAYKAWTEKLAKEANAGSKAAKDKIVIEQLKKMGLYNGPKFTSYCSFKPEFGTALDKFEAMGEANKLAHQKLKNFDLEFLLHDKKFFPTFKHFCEKTGQVAEVLAFVNGGHEQQPQVIYNTFIKPGAKYQLNIDDRDLNDWNEMARTKNWSKAKASVNSILPTQEGYLNNAVEKFLKHEGYRSFMLKDLKAPDPAKLKQAADKCTAMAVAYFREAEAYGKRWSAMKPDFWTPLKVALEKIMKGINELSK